MARKERGDKDKRKLTPALRQIIEGMALRKPRLPTATTHREVAETSKKLGLEPPSYKVVHAVIGKLEPALVTLAHEGSKAYSESFDLVHRREADAPNTIWQADHTDLDILVKDADGTPRRKPKSSRLAKARSLVEDTNSAAPDNLTGLQSLCRIQLQDGGATRSTGKPPLGIRWCSPRSATLY